MNQRPLWRWIKVYCFETSEKISNWIKLSSWMLWNHRACQFFYIEAERVEKKSLGKNHRWTNKNVHISNWLTVYCLSDVHHREKDYLNKELKTFTYLYNCLTIPLVFLYLYFIINIVIVIVKTKPLQRLVLYLLI